MEWALELALSYGLPVAATMCIGPLGDGDGVLPGECAVRMARAGAPIIGVNCLFGPFENLETLKLMKAGLDSSGLAPYLMSQPLGYRTPDTGRYGWVTLPEFPFAMEPRLVTRWEAAKWAQEAYDLGVRVLGGCCGFEPYHIRAIAEELSEERGRLPAGSEKSGLKVLKDKADLGRPDFKNKGDKSFWMSMIPSTGRPLSAPLNITSDPQLVSKAVMK